MDLSVDFAVIFCYLSLILVVGFLYGKSVSSVREYSVGLRDFPTPILAMTIIATWLSGSGTMNIAADVYRFGLLFVVVRLGQVASQLFTIYFLAPRIQKYMHLISIGDIMEEIYGKSACVITGISGFMLCMGFAAAQVKAMSFVMHYFAGIKPEFAVYISSFIMVFYAAFGGIRSVTITDAMQFVIFIIAIPIICYLGIELAGGYEKLWAQHLVGTNALQQNPAAQSRGWTLFIYFALPILHPPVMQRMMMARDLQQIYDTGKMAAIAYSSYIFIAGFIGLVAAIVAPNIVPKFALMHIVQNHLPVGVKGLALIGMLSVIMSTADSYINSGGISFVHDTIRPIFNVSEETELLLLKLLTFVTGMLGTVIALSFNDLLDIILFVQNFWSPVVAMPLLLGLLGFRCSNAVLMTGMLAGFLTFISWHIFGVTQVVGFGSLIPSCLANVVVLFIANYFSMSNNDLATKKEETWQSSEA